MRTNLALGWPYTHTRQIAVAVNNVHVHITTEQTVHTWAQYDRYVRFSYIQLQNTVCITKTCLYNFDPLKPHICMVKLGFTGVYIILLTLLKINCRYSLEPPRIGGSNEYPQSMF